MAQRTARTQQTATIPARSTDDRRRAASYDADRVAERRTQLRLRHYAALTSLMDERTDLRGVHALADHIDDAIRWSA